MNFYGNYYFCDNLIAECRLEVKYRKDSLRLVVKLFSQRRRVAKSGIVNNSIGMGFSPFFTMSLGIGFSQNSTLVSAKAFVSFIIMSSR